MLESLLSSLLAILTLQHFIYMLMGVLTGLMVGILPGLGGIAGLSLLIPFLYGMESTTALAMLIGLVAVIPTSDTFASVLMGIPGTAGSQATLTLSNALPSSTTTLIVGIATLNAPFKGGVMVPAPLLFLFGLPTGPLGELPLNTTWPALPLGFSIYLQHWIVDAAGPAGFSASNGLQGETQ